MGVSEDYLTDAIKDKYILSDDAVLPLNYFDENVSSEPVMTILTGEDYCWIEEGDFTLVQHTGLHTGDGRLIFEGDLLQWVDDKGLNDTVYYEVFFDNGDGPSTNGFKMSRTHYKGSLCGGFIPPFNLHSTSRMRVAGNIFQNPELLSNV